MLFIVFIFTIYLFKKFVLEILTQSLWFVINFVYNIILYN